MHWGFNSGIIPEVSSEFFLETPAAVGQGVFFFIS